MPASKGVAEAVVGQEEAGVDTWLRVAEMFSGKSKTAIYLSISKNPRAAQEKAVRKLLKKSRSKEVLLALLGAQVAEDFQEIFLRLLKLDRILAVNHLAEYGLPEGARLPEDVVQDFLSSNSRKERVLAVTLVDRMSKSQDKKKEVKAVKR